MHGILQGVGKTGTLKESSHSHSNEICICFENMAVEWKIDLEFNTGNNNSNNNNNNNLLFQQISVVGQRLNSVLLHDGFIDEDGPERVHCQRLFTSFYNNNSNNNNNNNKIAGFITIGDKPLKCNFYPHRDLNLCLPMLWSTTLPFWHPAPPPHLLKQKRLWMTSIK